MQISTKSLKMISSDLNEAKINWKSIILPLVTSADKHFLKTTKNRAASTNSSTDLVLLWHHLTESKHDAGGAKHVSVKFLQVKDNKVLFSRVRMWNDSWCMNKTCRNQPSWARNCTVVHWTCASAQIHDQKMVLHKAAQFQICWQSEWISQAS